MRIPSLPVLALTLVVATGAPAHDLWLEKTPPAEGPYTYRLHHGHSHTARATRGTEGTAHDHGGSPAASLEILSAICIDDQGNRSPISPLDNHPFAFDCDGPAIAVTVTTGFWTKTAHGTKPFKRNEATMPVRSWRSLESVKRIDRWIASLREPLTGDLELVPQADPLELREGDKLQLLVTLAGRPVSGAVVTYGGRARGSTGADGRIDIRIHRPGLQKVRAKITLPFDGPEADETVHIAVLNFEVPEK